MKKEEFKDLILDGVSSYFVYKQRSAIANLQNYLNNTAGIGEHGDIVKECIKLVEDIEHAESCINLINHMDKDII